MGNELIIIITGSIVALLSALALFVIASNVSGSIKTSFAMLCLSLAIWTAANTCADIFLSTALLWTRLSFAAVALSLACMVVFVLNFPRKAKHLRVRIGVAIAIGSVVAALSFTKDIVPSVVISDGYANVVTGELYALYVIYIISIILVILGVLLYRLRTEDTAINRDRIRFILLGTAITAIIAILTNLIIPLLSGTNPLAIYGSFATLAFISMVAYAIVRHQLFSIRVATARAVAYLLSGGSLGLFFGIVIFWVGSSLFADSIITTNQRIFYTLLAVLVGFSFPAIRAFFDHLTKRIFLRDIYDPKQVLENVAAIVTKTKSSKALMRYISKELYEQLHIGFVEAYLFEEDRWQRKARVGVVTTPNRVENIAELLAATDEVVVTLGQEDFEQLGREDIGLIMILKTPQNVLGYLAIGYKQNGTSFTSNDKSLLVAVANETAIAAENYLRFEAIEQFNETLQANIREATDELRTTNKKLRMLDESKDEFISMASHQLRTPLTSVKGYLSMVLEGDVGKITAAQRKVLEEAFNSSQRMVYLISDFLNVSRLQTGKFELEKSDVRLPDIITQELAQLQASAQARKVTLNYTPPTSFPTLAVDENKIRQVMMNFIDNAIYYAKPNGGTITVTLAKYSSHVSFRVIDDGIGVPKSEQRQLFTKFYRASNARQARPDGTGIGLFMAKKVIVAHGGAIIFETKEGQGSTFGFRLPLEDSAQ